jgi:hypothetical protein
VKRLGAAAAVALALAAGLAGARARDAAAADECRGLMVCLPVAGPWVVIPAKSGAGPARVEFELRCPLPGYIVAGTDVRLADPDIDVALRGETGSPVGPGVTTSEAVLFVATYVGPRRAPTSFRPFVGCVPTSGGGGRALTAAAALRPTRPVTRRVAEKRLFAGAATRVVARCRGRETAVDASHAVAFRTPLPPGRSLIESVRATSRFTPDRAVATATARAGLPPTVRAFVQVIAHCRKDAP